MLERDPVIILRNLVSGDYEAANTPIGDDPRFHTGWYDYASSDPQVTFTNPEEGTVDGGDTGITAGTGEGGAVLVRSGTVTVNCWAGTRSDMRGVGPGGEDVNPKAGAYQMAREVAGVLNDNSGGTQNPDTGEQELLSIAGNARRPIVDTDGPETVFRYEVLALYTYVEEHN